MIILTNNYYVLLRVWKKPVFYWLYGTYITRTLQPQPATRLQGTLNKPVMWGPWKRPTSICSVVEYVLRNCRGLSRSSRLRPDSPRAKPKATSSTSCWSETVVFQIFRILAHIGIVWPEYEFLCMLAEVVMHERTRAARSILCKSAARHLLLFVRLSPINCSYSMCSVQSLDRSSELVPESCWAQPAGSVTMPVKAYL